VMTKLFERVLCGNFLTIVTVLSGSLVNSMTSDYMHVLLHFHGIQDSVRLSC